MKKLSFQIAFGGIASAVCLVFLLFTGMIPMTEYAAPEICGIIIYIVSYECSMKTAVTAYAAVSILCLLLSPNKELALMFCGFFGYFPILNEYLARHCRKLVKWILRHAVFNIAMVLSYWLLKKIFGIDAIDDFDGYALLFLALANVILPFYCIWCQSMLWIYTDKLRKRFFKRK